MKTTHEQRQSLRACFVTADNPFDVTVLAVLDELDTAEAELAVEIARRKADRADQVAREMNAVTACDVPDGFLLALGEMTKTRPLIVTRCLRMTSGRHSLFLVTAGPPGAQTDYVVGRDDDHDDAKLIATQSAPFTFGGLVHMMCNATPEEVSRIIQRTKEEPRGPQIFGTDADSIARYVEEVRADERRNIGRALGMDGYQPVEWFTQQRINEHVEGLCDKKPERRGG